MIRDPSEGVAEVAFGWLKRASARKARRVGVSEVLDYGPVWRRMTQVFWLFPVAIAVINFYSPPSPEQLRNYVWVIVGFCAVLVPFSLEVFQRKIELTDQRISQTSAWSKPVTIAWKDVRDVVWRISSEVEIQPGSGRSIRVNAWLSGMETFAEVLEKRLGHLPSIPGVIRKIQEQLEP